jgi:hypothetical protein
VSSMSPAAMNAALAQVDKAQVDAFIGRGVNEALAVALVMGDIIIDNGPDALPLNAQAKPLIVRELDWLAKQPSPSLPRKGAEAAGGWKQTKGLALQALGVIRTFNLDARVQVSTRDVSRYRIAQILLSFPIANGPKLKIRQPRERFKSRRREPTENELRGLAIGRAKVSEAARKRREAKAAAHA